METSITAGPLLSLAVTVTSEQHVDSVLRKIVDGLASQPGVALVRIWLLPSVHIPNAWQEGAHSQHGIEHLRLVASAGNPIRSPGEDWSFLQGRFSRFPLNIGKVGQLAADRHPVFIKDLASQDTWVVRPEWAEREEIRSFAGHPLIFQEKLLGVIGLFSRRPLDEQEFTWLGLFANHAAIAIANARAFEEVAERQKSLRRSEAFLAEGQRLGQIGSYSWRVATGEITWSEQLYRIYEFEIGVPLTLDLIRTRVHPEDLTLYEKMVEQARNGENDFEWHYRLLMPDHSIKYLHAVARATRDQDGQLEYIAAIQDVTPRRLSEEARDKARSELAHVARVMSLGTLAASIAHEINQPLSGIVTNAGTCQRMLAAAPPNVDGALETARRTIRDANRASEVITRLRALFSRKETATETVDLNEATREVIALSLSGLQRNQVLVRAELAEHLPLVMGDRVQLQQVVLNLLRNAADAVSTIDDRPRELLVRTERAEGNQVQLSVKDSGVGFAPEAADRIFEGFYTTKTDGMGIGLSISRSIIETHHGRLWATQNDGPGSTFSFAIPCALDAA